MGDSRGVPAKREMGGERSESKRSEGQRSEAREAMARASKSDGR